MDAYLSRNFPALPRQITTEYAGDMTKALRTGDPREFAVNRDSAVALAAESSAR